MHDAILDEGKYNSKFVNMRDHPFLQEKVIHVAATEEKYIILKIVFFPRTTLFLRYVHMHVSWILYTCINSTLIIIVFLQSKARIPDRCFDCITGVYFNSNSHVMLTIYVFHSQYSQYKNIGYIYVKGHQIIPAPGPPPPPTFFLETPCIYSLIQFIN